MPQVEHEIVIKATPERVFRTVADFGHYPEMQPEVTEALILKETKTTAEVAFTMKLIAEVNYTLKFKFKKPTKISWTMSKGDSMLKKNEGEWTIAKHGKSQSKLGCRMEVEFGGWIPGGIIRDLMGTHLPAMMERFKEAAEA